MRFRRLHDKLWVRAGLIALPSAKLHGSNSSQRNPTMSHSHSDNPNEPTDGPDTASQTIGSIFFAAFTLAVIVGFSVWMYIRLGWNLL